MFEFLKAHLLDSIYRTRASRTARSNATANQFIAFP